MLNDNIFLEERKFGDGTKLIMGSSRDVLMAREKRDQDGPGKAKWKRGVQGARD